MGEEEEFRKRGGRERTRSGVGGMGESTGREEAEVWRGGVEEVGARESSRLDSSLAKKSSRARRGRRGGVSRGMGVTAREIPGEKGRLPWAEAKGGEGGRLMARREAVEDVLILDVETLPNSIVLRPWRGVEGAVFSTGLGIGVAWSCGVAMEGRLSGEDLRIVAGSGYSSILLRLGEEVEGAASASASSPSPRCPLFLTSRTLLDCVLETLGRRTTSKDGFVFPSTASSPSSQFHASDVSSSRLCLPVAAFLAPHPRFNALAHFPFERAAEALMTRERPFDEGPSPSAL